MKGFYPERKRLGDALRSWRRERGESLRALGARTGVSFTTLSRIERGEAAPDVFEADRLGQAVGLTLPELVAGVGADRVYGTEMAG